MEALLGEGVDRGVVPDFAGQLLTAVGEGTKVASHGQGLVEPLSDREQDVLRLLATDLSGPEIAGELVVSLNTVRTHTQRIYTKLGVGNRRLAVRRARELDLL
jgi:LuxR family maltose regulon positive regulatory protein